VSKCHRGNGADATACRMRTSVMGHSPFSRVGDYLESPLKVGAAFGCGHPGGSVLNTALLTTGLSFA
jgi:hypothetical protein